MTPEEQATTLWHSIRDELLGGWDEEDEQRIEAIAAAIRDAEASGWEACAQLAERYWGGYYAHHLRTGRNQGLEGT